MRNVLVDETGEITKAYAFTNDDELRARAIPLIKARLEAEDLLAEYDDNRLGTMALDLLGEIESSVMILDEGPEGVWTGFSSADRCSIGGPLPHDEHEFLGNGDAHAYRTAGVPDGEAVLGEELPYEEEDEDDE